MEDLISIYTIFSLIVRRHPLEAVVIMTGTKEENNKEEGGVDGWSNKPRTFSKATAVHVPVKPKVKHVKSCPVW